jgi:hypothetical protein
MPRVPIRTYATAAYGALGSMRINRVGPIGFVDEWARWQLPIQRRGTGVQPTKILVVVADGTTVTVTVPTAETAALRLFYRQPTPSSVDGFSDMATGDRTMTFESCPRAKGTFGSDALTQFPGYFLVNQPGCYRVDISEHGSTRALQADLSLGRPC